MSMTQFTRRLIDRRLTAYCERKVPVQERSNVQIAFRIQWNRVTLIKTMGCGRDDSPGSTLPVAQLRYDDLNNRWTLYYADRNSGWHLYPGIRPTPNFNHLLEEVDSDPTGIFWNNHIWVDP